MEKGCTVSRERFHAEASILGAQNEKKQPPANAKWILVMSDEEIIRIVLRVMLEKSGHKVYATENGEEAVACCQEAHCCGYPFDAAILDLNIRTGLGIRETVAQLSAITPNVKVIATSGDSEDPLMSDFRSHGFSGALAKPFSFNELMQVFHRSFYA